MIATENSAPARPAVWRPCPICWGQRRVLGDRNGEGLVPHPCLPASASAGSWWRAGKPRARAVAARASRVARRTL
jgi:hypothetical protein